MNGHWLFWVLAVLTFLSGIICASDYFNKEESLGARRTCLVMGLALVTYSVVLVVVFCL